MNKIFKKLKELNRDELNVLAQKLHIKGYRKLKKETLLDYISREIPENKLKQELNIKTSLRKKRKILFATITIIASIFGILAYFGFDLNFPRMDFLRKKTLSNVRNLTEKILITEVSLDDKNPTVVELHAYGAIAINSLLDILKIEIVQYWERMEERNVEVSSISYVDNKLEIPIKQHFSKYLKNKRVRRTIDVLKLFSKIDEQKTAKEIGKYIIKNSKTEVAPLLIYFFPEFTKDKKLIKQYAYCYAKPYLESNNGPGKILDFVGLCSLRNYLGFSETLTIFAGTKFSSEEKNSDLKTVRIEEIITVPDRGLSGLDLSFLELSSLGFSDFQLTFTDFLSSSIKFATFEDMTLASSRFDFARIYLCNLLDVNIENCLFKNSKFSRNDLRNITFRNINAEGFIFENTKKASNISFIDCSFKNSYFINVNFENCTFTNTKFEDTEFNGVTFDEKSQKSFDSIKNNRNITIVNNLFELEGSNEAFPSKLSEKLLAISLMEPIELPYGKTLNSEAWFERGKTYRDAGEYKTALEAFDKSISEKIKEPEILKQKGITYYYKGDLLKAKEILEKSKQISPKDSEIYLYIGMSELALNKIDNSIKYFNESLESDAPKNYPAAIKEKLICDTYYYRGHAYARKGDIENAITDFSSSIKLYATSHSLIERGRLWLKKDNFKNAVNDFNNAEFYDERNAELYWLRAQAHFELNEFDKALSDCNKSLEIAPNNVELYFIRSFINNNLENYTAALKDINKVMSLGGGGGYLYAIRGDFLIKVGEYDKAKEDLDRALNLGSIDRRLYQSFFLYFSKKNALNDAILFFSKCISDGQKEPMVFYFRGLSFYYSKKYNSAIEDLTEYLKSNPTDVSALRLRGDAYSEIGGLDKAQNDFDIIYENKKTETTSVE